MINKIRSKRSCKEERERDARVRGERGRGRGGGREGRGEEREWMVEHEKEGRVRSRRSIEGVYQRIGNPLKTKFELE